MTFERSSRIRLPDRKVWMPLLGVWTVFILSRILYDRAGIRFQGGTFNFYWQFIDPVLLRTDLLRSLFYLHGQPPLLNLFTGVILMTFPKSHDLVFHLLYFLMGMVLGTSIYCLGIFLRQPRWASAMIAAWFMISPSTVLYEHWLTYAYPVTCALTLSGICLYQFTQTGKAFWGLLFFSLLGGIALTWSLFHLIWLVGVVALLLVFFRERKKILLAALLPILLVTAWYAKNYFVVGEFTASTWAGMNLSRITTFRLSKLQRNSMIKSGQLSEFAEINPFSWPASYLELLPDTPHTGIPLLDIPVSSSGNPNVHHLVYIEASKNYLKDALYVIRTRPGFYLRNVVQAYYVFFHPSSDASLVQQDVPLVKTLDHWWKIIFSGQLQNDDKHKLLTFSAEYVGWWIVVSFVLSIAGSAVFLWQKRKQISEPANFLILFMAYNIVFLTVVGNMIELGENHRFRFTIEPLVLVLFIFFVREIWAGFKADRQK